MYENLPLCLCSSSVFLFFPCAAISLVLAMWLVSATWKKYFFPFPQIFFLHEGKLSCITRDFYRSSIKSGLIRKEGRLALPQRLSFFVYLYLFMLVIHCGRSIIALRLSFVFDPVFIWSEVQFRCRNGFRLL